MITQDKIREYNTLKDKYFELAFVIAISNDKPLQRFQAEMELQEVHRQLSELFDELKSMGIDPFNK